MRVKDNKYIPLMTCESLKVNNIRVMLEIIDKKQNEGKMFEFLHCLLRRILYFFPLNLYVCLLAEVEFVYNESQGTVICIVCYIRNFFFKIRIISPFNCFVMCIINDE